MRRIALLGLLAALLPFVASDDVSARPSKEKSETPSSAAAESQRNELRTARKKMRDRVTLPANLRGWGYLYERLVELDTVSPEELAAVFSDRRMPKNGPLYFSVEPREPRDIYTARLTESERQNALSFYESNWSFFR
ncbi:MAG: hypothetical protein KDD44_08330, partial [Bdellovibrionales bacterium]|nr:hypothetical protein [Bdellovibrionales bacterium]